VRNFGKKLTFLLILAYLFAIFLGFRVDAFKLFSFDGSGGSSDASAKLSPAAAFAIECSMRGRGKDCTDFSISSALEEIRS